MTDQIPYSDDELMGVGPQRTFTGAALREIAFPLGGIGAGCVALGGRGQLRDWEVFHRPSIGFRPDFTFATLRTETADGSVVTKVLESPLPPPYTSSFGSGQGGGEGFPHMAAAAFTGEYPIARIDFADDAVPLKVSLEAFNPFIPLDADESSLPVAILTYRLKNAGDRDVSALLCWTVQNIMGYPSQGGPDAKKLGGNLNVFRSADGLNGLVLTTNKHDEDSPQFGSMALATPCPDVTYTGQLEGRGFDLGHRFWDAVNRQGTFDDQDMAEPTEEGRTAVGALGVKVRLAPGESVDVPFLLAWHVPNVQKYWGNNMQPCCDEPYQWKAYYTKRFADAWEVAAYVNANMDALRGETLKYRDALFGSTLPATVLDAASSQTGILKSATCLRLEDGTFYGFEGHGDTWGCCEGSCTHVWNYQQALPFLFPALERSMRTVDYLYNLREEDGKMCFRLALPLGTSHWGFHACVDGQLGGVIKTYRDWLLCGDDEWLKSIWPRVRKALAYAWEEWDPDKDGVIDAVQHNTYDIEFQGPNPLSGAFYMGALRAAEEMARHMGEDDQADEYRAIFEKGSAKLDEMIFNGEYYYQIYDAEKVTTQQFGEGCLSDQLLGQWLAAICDLGYVFKPENVRTTLASIFRNNWRASLADHSNPMRIYALGDEAGLLMASWPHGNRPLIPTLYSDEVWTGIEYQAASHMIMEDMVREGLAIVKGARDRHDGVRRNPWDEFECGSHYARAMSSWGLIVALSGYFCDAPQGLLQFDPKVHADDFRTFWSNDAAWGTYSQEAGEGSFEARLAVLHGEQRLGTLRLRTGLDGTPSVMACVDGQEVACTSQMAEGWLEVTLQGGATVPAGMELSVHVTG